MRTEVECKDTLGSTSVFFIVIIGEIMSEIISGIYMIENIINNKKYIGQSSNIYIKDGFIINLI